MFVIDSSHSNQTQMYYEKIYVDSRNKESKT